MKTGPSLEHPGPSAVFLHSYAFPQHDDIFLREEGEEVRLLACEFLHSWTYSILRYVSSNLLILGLCGSTYLLDLYLAETWEGHTQVSSLVGYFAVCFWIIIMLEHSSTSKLLEIGIYFVSQYFWYIHMPEIAKISQMKRAVIQSASSLPHICATPHFAVSVQWMEEGEVSEPQPDFWLSTILQTDCKTYLMLNYWLPDGFIQ